MFVQVVQGRVTDRAAVHAQIERWEGDLKPGAFGFLGSTAGLTRDGELVVVARFESQQAAARNSDRSEQDAWWRETAALLEDVSFLNCREVYLIRGGGSDRAGFVQVMQGIAKDAERMKAIDDQMGEWLQQYRPDHLGALVAWRPDGRFTHTVYFTSEEEARIGERRMEAGIPEDVRMLLEEWRSLADDLRYVDLEELWLSAP